MNAPSFASIYNPRGHGDDDKFIAEFVARRALFETLLRRLRATDADEAAFHHILIGPRGMGKTSLLRRIAIEIDREPHLAARFIPLTFREEQYNVLTLGDFWRNCGEALAEWAEVTGRADLARHLDDALPTKAWASDEAAAEQFNAKMAALDRRAVLLVDNLDFILDALPPESNWALRRRLQARRGPILVGASTHALRQAADREAAFYEFFDPSYLEPLGDRETELCLRALARNGGEHGVRVVRILDTEPERLKTLHILTGGNPRVLALIYRLLGTGESDAAMADLERLLDEVTPYYKAKIEEYQTPQQRAVIDAIALHWDPVTTGDLAHLTHVPATTLSPLLIRLRKDGLIETVELSGAYAGHQLVERFLNIWYLMRHGTRRTKLKMRWLVAFLTSFYSLSELTEIAERAPERTIGHREYQFAFNEALALHASRAKDDQMQGLTIADPDTARSLQSTPSNLAPIAIGDDSSARLADAPERGPGEQIARALFNKALALDQMGDSAAALATYDEVAARFADAPEPGLRWQVAMALVNKAYTLGQMGDSAAALATYDEVIVRFADAREPGLREQVAMALVNKANTLGRMGDSAAALATYDDIVVHFADAPEPGLRERVARALFNKALALDQMGDSAAALATYDEVAARFADAPEPGLRWQVAMALVNKAYTLGQMGDSAAALATYDEVIVRFADAREPGLREQVAMALVNKANTLGRMGDSAAALATYDDIVVHFADAPEPGLRERVARALFNKAVTLGQMGDSAAAIATYDEVITRFADAPEPGLRERVAIALFNKAVMLGRMGDSAAAIATYDDIVARFSDAPEPGLREQVAMALVNKANTLGRMGDSAAAIATYDEVVARFSDAPEPGLRERVAMALVNKANTLSQMGGSAVALATYDEVLTRFADASEPGLREQVAKALFGKALMLGQMGDSAAAIATCDDVVARFADAPEPGPREQVAMALFNKANTLGQMGDSAAAIATYDEVLARFADAPEPGLREQVAMALIIKAKTLRNSGQITAAIDAFEKIIRRTSGEYYNSTIATFSAEARIGLANILLDLHGDFTRPEMLYKEAAETSALMAKANLAWLYLLADRPSDASRERRELNDLPSTGLGLLNAGIDLASDNFGSATSHLAISLDHDLDTGRMRFDDDLERLLRLAQHKGYGRQLLTWFEQTGFADRLAPLYVAFKAFVETDKFLLDVNPEVRGPARIIYDRLDASRRHAAALTPQKPKPLSRPRKTASRGRS